MGAWALRSFVKSIRLISLFGRSNFLRSLSVYVSIVRSVGTPYAHERCSDIMLLVVLGRYALATVALNQQQLKIKTRPRSLVQRLEMSVKYSSAPTFRSVHRTEILTLQ